MIKLPFLRKIIIIAAVLLITTAGICFSRNNLQESIPVSLFAAEEVETMSVYEYGTVDSLTNKPDEDLIYNILFPYVGFYYVDLSVKSWANGVLQRARRDVTALKEQGIETTGEIHVAYNSYLTEDRYVGIEETGTFSSAYTNLPSHFVKTFNIDIFNMKLLSANDILNSETALPILREYITTLFPDLPSETFENMDDSWFKNIVINKNEIIILFESGTFLPKDLGLQRFIFSIEDFGDSFILGKPKPTANPTTEPTAIPTESPTSEPVRSIDPEKPMIALTFDDGPCEYTPLILDLLEKHNAKATFFVLGGLVKSNADTIKRIHDSGNEVANHSWNHPQLSKLSYNDIWSQIQWTNEAVFKITGAYPTLLRPPYGSVNSTVHTVTADFRMVMVYWSIDTRDWEHKDPERTYEMILEKVQNGSIILCHDIHEKTYEAMIKVIPDLISQGYQLVTVSELFSFSAEPRKAGQLYSRQ